MEPLLIRPGKRGPKHGSDLRTVVDAMLFKAGRTDSKPSLVVIDSHLSRGAYHGGETFHRRGGPYGATNGAKRVVAVDVTGLPLAARVVSANLTETQATERVLECLVSSGQADRLEVVLVDKGVPERSARRLSRQFGFEVRRVGWDPQPVDPVTGKRVFKPLVTPSGLRRYMGW